MECDGGSQKGWDTVSHIKTSVKLAEQWGTVYIDDADGNWVAMLAGNYSTEIATALNERDKLVAERADLLAQREALVGSLARARQTFRNLILGGFVEAEDSASAEIWHNELENMRAALALVRGEDQ